MLRDGQEKDGALPAEQALVREELGRRGSGLDVLGGQLANSRRELVKESETNRAVRSQAACFLRVNLQVEEEKQAQARQS
jgi:hypothetical protein